MRMSGTMMMRTRNQIAMAVAQRLGRANAPRQSPSPLAGFRRGQESDYSKSAGGSGGGPDDHRRPRRIRAEAQCPRCSYNRMELLLTPNAADSPPTGGESVSQCEDEELAVNVCPNCKTPFFYRVQRITPLHGNSVEIGRLANKRTSNQPNYRARAAFSDSRRNKGAGGGEEPPPENWPANGLAVHTPPGPPFAPGVNVIRASDNGGNKAGWGGSNLGHNFPTPKQICEALDKFVIGQHKAKKVFSLFIPGFR